MPWLLLLIPVALIGGYAVIKANTPSGAAGATGGTPVANPNPKTYGVNVAQATPAPVQMHVGDVVILSFQIDPNANEDNQQGCGATFAFMQNGAQVTPGNGVAGNVFMPNSTPSLNQVGTNPDPNGYVTQTVAYTAVLTGTISLQVYYEDFSNTGGQGGNGCPYPSSAIMQFVVT